MPSYLQPGYGLIQPKVYQGPVKPGTSEAVFRTTGYSGGSSTSSGGGGLPSGTGSNPASFKIDTSGEEDAAKSADKAYRAQIDAEYNDVMGSLGLQENQYNAQLPFTEQQITQSYDSTIPTLNQEEATKFAGLEGQATTATQETGGILNKARQTYNELLSGAGRFQGSAQEAFGELLGRSTASTMGDARQELMKVLTGIAGEKTNVQTFYASRKTNLEKEKVLAIEQARQDTRNEIARINQDRTKAEGWKKVQNMQALANFQQSMASIKSAAQTAQRSIDMWLAEKQSALDETRAKAVATYRLKPIDLNRIGLSISPQGAGAYEDYLNNNQPWSNVQGYVTGNGSGKSLSSPTSSELTPEEEKLAREYNG